MAGPIAKQSENDTLSSVLPASSWPSGLRVAATAPRVRARPTSARTPSAAARASTSGSHGEEVSSANVAKIAASTRYSVGSTRRTPRRSSCAVAAGPTMAGTNSVHSHKAVVASALCV